MKPQHRRRSFLILIALALLVFFFFLPKILSTPVGKPVLEKALSKELDATVKIKSVHLSWRGPQVLKQITFSGDALSGSIDELASDVPLWKITQFGNAFLLKNGSFTFPSFNQVSITQVEAQINNREIQAGGAASQGGSFTVRGKIYSKTDFDIVADFRGMPPAPFDEILGTQGMLTAALGQTMNLSGHILYHETTGQMKLNLSSPNASMTLQGKIEQGVFTPSEPVNASLTLTPELSQALKARTSISILRAKNPFTLQIAPDGTSIPLFPFEMDQLQIGKGTLDLGQIVCNKMPGIVSFLTLLHRAPAASSEIPIWFTPLFFSVDRGILHAGRLDALISNGIHVCSWGDIDLIRSQLDMIFGIPADTLESTLGIKNLSPKYILKIPVQGPIQKPKFDTKPAATKITMMLAGQQVSKKTGVFGKLFDPLSKINDDRNNPPPNRPFPWEK